MEYLGGRAWRENVVRVYGREVGAPARERGAGIPGRSGVRVLEMMVGEPGREGLENLRWEGSWST